MRRSPAQARSARRHRACAGRSLRRSGRRRSPRSSPGSASRRSSCEADIATRPRRQASSTRCDERFGTRARRGQRRRRRPSRPTLFTDTPDHFDQHVDVNVKAPYFLIQAAARVMIRDGRARLDRQRRLDVDGHGGQPKLDGVLDVEGRAGDDDQEPGLRPDASRHPGQPGQPGLDGHRVGAPDADHPGRRARDWLELAEAGPPVGSVGASRGRSPT